MNQYILYILGTFIVSMICGIISIPQIIYFCQRRELYDIPNARKIHKSGIPRLGGLCFLPSMLVAFVLAMVTFNNMSADKQITISLWSIFFIISLVLIYSVGMVDDLIGLGARTKFAVQLLAALMLPASGLYINNFYGFFGIYEIPYFIGMPLTVFVIVFIDNAINLIDGIDGLAAGLSVIALAGFLFCFYGERLLAYCILISGLMGVLIAFLYFNLFGDTKKGLKIFMGDSGSLTIGFILGFLFVKFSMDNPNVMPFRRDSLLLSCTLLLVPVFDVLRVIIVRISHHKPIFDADKNHIHHKLMRTGMGQRNALVVILALSVFYIIFNLFASKYLYFNIIVALDIIIWMVFHAVVNVFIKRHGAKAFVMETGNGNN